MAPIERTPGLLRQLLGGAPLRGTWAKCAPRPSRGTPGPAGGRARRTNWLQQPQSLVGRQTQIAQHADGAAIALALAGPPRQARLLPRGIEPGLEQGTRSVWVGLGRVEKVGMRRDVRVFLVFCNYCQFSSGPAEAAASTVCEAYASW